MAVQATATIDSTGIVLYGSAYFQDDLTFAQDGARATSLATYTVMAKQISDGYYVPLTDVDPALVPANLACGAIGGSAQDFQALASASFKIGIDGETAIEVVCDFSGLDTEADTPGYYTCGANGGNVAAYAAVANGEFAITVNGVTINVTGLDFNTVAVTALQQVEEVINEAANGRFRCEYDLAGDLFKFISNTTGETSTVAALAAVSGGTGTDISGAGFLNGAAAGSATAGTGGEGLFESIVDIINAELAGRATCSFDGDKFIFWSPTQGYDSAITALTAGATGTDISGASYLNGLAAAATVTAATTGDGTNVPAAIYIGDTILAATLVAADVTNRKCWIKGEPIVLDEAKVVLENSLTLASVVTATGKTIRQHLEDLGFLTRDSAVNGQIAPI